MHKQYFYAKIKVKIYVLEQVMEEKGLFALIRHLERGTRLHIGVLFFGNYGNELCRLPHSHSIHAAPICEHFKRTHLDYRRCFRCRNLALKKALETKAPFGGLCSNGIYEYTHPVVVGGDVAAVIFIGNILLSGKEPSRLTKRLEKARGLIDTMETEISAEETASLARIIEEYIFLLFDKGGARSVSDDALIENVKSYIRSNMEFDVCTAHIASVFHYNKSYLGRRFKQESGLSIAEYLAAVRIERAKIYLTRDRLTVTEISERCGFSAVGYFNRLFKAATGKTPTDYRREKSLRKTKPPITK